MQLFQLSFWPEGNLLMPTKEPQTPGAHLWQVGKHRQSWALAVFLGF